jgi:Spy/CpxP family protein refolding chaperone
MTIETQTPRPQRRWGRLLLAAALIFGLGGVAGFGIGAHKASAFFWHAMGPGKLTPEETAAMVERKVNHVLSHVDATEEQKAKVSAIAKAAAADLAKLGFPPREGRAKFLALIRADKIEPEAIEALRVDQSAKWDAASKRIAQAVSEAAAVLTPEQRRELTERWARRLSS